MIDPRQISLRDAAVKANPYPLYARLRQEGPVIRLPGLARHFWLVTRYDDVVTVLKDSRFVNDRRNVAGPPVTFIERLIGRIYGNLLWNMLTRDEPDHARLRSSVHNAFSAQRVQSLRERIETVAHELLDGVKNKPLWDVIADYAMPLPVTIIAEMPGVPERDRDRFRRWSTQVTVAFGSSVSGAIFKSPALLLVQRYIRWLIELRRREPGDDLISALVHPDRESGRLTERELLPMILLLLIAGQETTVNLIGSGVLALLENPEQMARLRLDPG